MTREEIETKLNEAEALNKHRKHEEAEILCREVVATLGASEDYALRSRALSILASSLSSRGSAKAALPIAEEALSLAILTEDILKQAKVMHLLGRVHRNLFNFSLALENYYKALPIIEDIGDKESAASITGDIGIACRYLSENATALEFYAKSLVWYEELGNKRMTGGTLVNIGGVYLDLGEYATALEYFMKALAIFDEIEEKPFKATVIGSIGTLYLYLSDNVTALEYFAKALTAHEELGDKAGVALTTGNIGNVHYNMRSYHSALEYMTAALAAHEELGDKAAAATVTTNIGIVHSDMGSYDRALECYGRAFGAFQELGDKAGAARVLGSIGLVHSSMGSYDRALECLGKALATNEEHGMKASAAITTGNIGDIYMKIEFDGYDAAKAEEILLKALAMDEELGHKKPLYHVHKSLADLYKTTKQWEKCQMHFEKYHDIKEEVESEDAKKQANLMEQQKQIAVAKAAVEARHQATEQLLHNVLPPSIADKMLTSAKIIAEKLSNVSVLFADIVEFTKLSQRITPEELVEGLDAIFSTIDTLAEKHGLEKIKTIGDAYMVVSGAPEPRADHAVAMAHFALEMVVAMKGFHLISTGEEIQLRIGIHSGEVVAGVIGKKKFAYDLWGDAVNTASRMESHGEAGKIHCSEEFMHALSLSSPTSPMSLHFIERGEMDIKGKGKMTTYFLERV